MNRQRQAKGKERLQALYLLKTVQCQQIIKVAVLIGRSRSTVHRWLDDYQQGGLPQLIGPGKKPGRKRKIPDWAVKQLEKRRQQPRGFQSYLEIQQWLHCECGLDVKYHVVYELVRYRLGAKRKRPRPVNQNQDSTAVEEFSHQLGQQLLKFVTNLPSKSQIRYWCEDESRFGMKTINRLKITALRVQPIGMSQWTFKTIWLYGMVELASSESALWEFSHLDSICFESFLAYFSQLYPDDMHIIQLDNSRKFMTLDRSSKIKM